MHQRSARLRPADKSCAAAGIASSAKGNSADIDARIFLPPLDKNAVGFLWSASHRVSRALARIGSLGVGGSAVAINAAREHDNKRLTLSFQLEFSPPIGRQLHLSILGTLR